jgi:hypothetical protein
MTQPFKLSIAWDGVSFSGVGGSDVTGDVRLAAGISCSRGKDQIRQAAPPVAGVLATELDNQARDYSPNNTSSPLYGLVVPPKKVRLSTVAVSGGGLELEGGGGLELEGGGDLQLQDTPARNVWTGILDDISQFPEPGRRSVGISCLGNLSRLRGKKISTALYQNISTSDALGILLDAAGWPSGERSIQAGTVTLAWWWFDGDTFTGAVELMLTEGARASLYEDARGYIVFENNEARTTQSRSVISQATFTDVSDIVEFSYQPNFKDLIVACQVTQVERAQQPLGIVWSYGQTLTLGNNEVKKLQVRASDPFKNVLEPSSVGTNEEQILIASAPLTDGTYKANINGTLTGDIRYDADAATHQAAFEAAVGTGNVQCGGSLATGLRVQFCGALKEKEIPLITIESSLNPGTKHATIRTIDITDGPDTTWKLYVEAALIFGQYKIKNHLGNKTAFLGYDSTASQIQTAIENQPVIVPGDVNVSGGPTDTTETIIAFTGALSGSAVPLSITDDASLMTATEPTATILVSRTVAGGGPDLVVSSGSVTFAFDRTSGAVVTMTATAGATGAVIPGLQVRGNLVSVIRSSDVTHPPDFDVSAAPDGQVYKPGIRGEISLDDAEANAEDNYDHFSVVRPALVIGVLTSLENPAGVDSLLRREISDRITIVEAQTGINNDCYIEQIRHTIEPMNNLLRSEFGCELI